MAKIFLILQILIISVYVQSQSFITNDYEITRRNFSINLKDGVKLDCTSISPIAERPENGFPCIVYCHGFGKNKEDNLSNAIILSKYGFVTYTYSMRGQGNSEGKSNLISITEAEDLIQVIEHIKKDTLADADRIAVIGSSQGGIIPLMGACNGLKVKCIISDLISPNFASNWIENGCVKMSLLWSLSYDESIVRYSDEVKKYRSWILSKRKDDWDSLVYYLPKRRDFSDRIKNNRTPVFISNSFQDKYFNSNSIIENLTNFNVSCKFYFGSIEGHGSSPAEEEVNFHVYGMNDWIDYWLNSSEQTEKNKYTVSFSTLPIVNSGWTYQRLYSNSSLFDKPNLIKFYFHPSSKITEHPYYGDTNFFRFRNMLNDSVYKMQEAINSEFSGNYFNSNFKKENLIFDSKPLLWNYNALGIPKLHLVYKSNKTVCQFNFQIYEVFSDGTSKLISSINYTDRNHKRKKKEETISGDAIGHIFSAGSKIRIILTNIDTRDNDRFLRTNPYVLPIFISSTSTIYTGSSNGSYIELPLKE